MSETYPLTINSIIVQSPNVFWQNVVGDVVILDVERAEYFGAEQVGAKIWEMMEEPTSVSTICSSLLNSYNVDRETCENDVLLFVRQLLEAGLIEVANGN